MKKIINIQTGAITEEALTDEEVARNETLASNFQDELNAMEEKENLKASAKAKLIAGEALTKDEANTIVL